MPNNVLPKDMVWPQFNDGTLVNIGDKVVKYSGCEFIVKKITYNENCWTLSGYDFTPIEVTKLNGIPFTKPFTDSWEQLEEDAVKSLANYWGCKDISCGECNIMKDEKTPVDFYKCDSCSSAMNLDIIARAKRIAEHERGKYAD